MEVINNISNSTISDFVPLSFVNQQLPELGPEDNQKFFELGIGKLTQPDYPDILTAFEDQVKKHGQMNAAIHAGSSITYEQLDKKACDLARLLIKKGVKPGDKVGLFVRRSIPMLVGIFGILKAGATYVPQDVHISPTPQLEYIAKAADLKVILTLSEYAHKIPTSIDLDCLNLDQIINEQNEETPGQLEIKNIIKPENICFLLFTSGTTGKPNGVKVTHKNLCNIILTSPGDLGIRPGLKVSQILNIAFDMSAWEIFGALTHGATLVIREKSIEETVSKVDVVISTPSVLASVDSTKCKNVKTVAVAGEPCPKPLANKWVEFATFYNSCGPTEVTIVNTISSYSKCIELSTGECNLDKCTNCTQKVPIGGPTPNNTVYVLDDDLKPMPIGEIGQMWAGGDCVTDGYLNNGPLTDDRYRPDPFLAGERKMFWTRDLGRWTPEGELEHFGRTDDQVKIKGFRVELDSISTALESAPECDQAITLKLDNQNLVSFVSPANLDTSSLGSLVENSLPYYCMPSLIIPMDEFPKTSRGKIDKRALTVMAVEVQENKEGANA